MKRNKYIIVDSWGDSLSMWPNVVAGIVTGRRPLTLSEVKEIKKLRPEAKVYKLVEVKLWNT